MSSPHYRLLTRHGCCLCEGLAERLAALEPAPTLELVDVDQDPDLLATYGLEVPVLAIAVPSGWRDLPRVSPRLSGTALQQWLLRQSSGAESA
jgi:hypothetical protein